MGKLLQLLAGIDWKTAGWKTYAGCAIVLACVIAGQLGKLDAEAVAAGSAFGAVLAGIGRLAAGKREDPAPPSDKPPEPPVVSSVAE